MEKLYRGSILVGQQSFFNMTSQPLDRLTLILLFENIGIFTQTRVPNKYNGYSNMRKYLEKYIAMQCCIRCITIIA